MMAYIDFEGRAISDNFTMKFSDFETPMKPEFFAMTGSNFPIKSVYEGYIGLAPFSEEPKTDNFVQQLIDNEIIDHYVFSMYITEESEASSIKFGSYDKFGLEPGTSLTTIRTIN